MSEKLYIKKAHEVVVDAKEMARESRTQQHEKDSADINVIVERYTVKGQAMPVNRREATYGDVSDAVELQEAINLQEEAKAEFESLDVKVREICENNPVKFLELLSSPDGVDKLRNAGLDVIAPGDPHLDDVGNPLEDPPQQPNEPPAPPAPEPAA